jgi:hypothetical protein
MMATKLNAQVIIKNLQNTVVGNSSPILDESPFRKIRRYLEPHLVVQTFDEFSEMEIRPKLGMSCRRLVWRAKIARFRGPLLEEF